MSRDYNPKSVVAYVRDVLSKMEEDDYLVPAGDPTLYAVAVACALEQFGKFNTLRWDNVNKRYDSMLFDFDYEDSTQ
jgi:hypothetical protein